MTGGLSWQGTRRNAAVAAACLLLAACASPAGSPAADGPSPEDDSGAPSPTNGAEPAGTISIGLPAGFTGPVTVPATSMQAATEIAIDEINSSGGLQVGDGLYTLELVTADDKCAPEEGVAALELLITQQAANFLVGGLCSSAVTASMHVAQRENVPYIITSASAATISNTIAEDELQYVFHFSPTETTVASNAAEAVLDLLSPSTIAVISEDTDAGRDSDRIFTEYVEENSDSAEIISHDFIRQDAGNMLAELSRIASDDPDVVFAFFTGVNNEIFAQQLLEVGLDSMLMTAGTEFARPDFVQANSEAAELALVNIRWSPRLANAATEEFMASFEEKTDRPVDFFALQQYDAVNMLAAAIEEAGTTDPAAVVEALESIEVDGVWGTHTFAPVNEGHTSPWQLVIAQVQDGAHVVVWPEEAAEADVQLRTQP